MRPSLESLTLTLTLTLGNASCAFGPSPVPPHRTYLGAWAWMDRSSEMVCDFPTIPDDERDQIGELNFEFRLGLGLGLTLTLT